MDIKTMTDEELITDFKQAYESVYILDCFGSSDMIRMELAGRELERRGYEITETPRIPKITKEG